MYFHAVSFFWKGLIALNVLSSYLFTCPEKLLAFGKLRAWLFCSPFSPHIRSMPYRPCFSATVILYHIPIYLAPSPDLLRFPLCAALVNKKNVLDSLVQRSDSSELLDEPSRSIYWPPDPQTDIYRKSSVWKRLSSLLKTLYPCFSNDWSVLLDHSRRHI